MVNHRRGHALRATPSAFAQFVAPRRLRVTIFRSSVGHRGSTRANPRASYLYGRHQLNRDGLEKCVGGAWACRRRDLRRSRQLTPKRRYFPAGGRVYQINYLRCIFCGMCIGRATRERLSPEATREDDIYGETCWSCRRHRLWSRGGKNDIDTTAGMPAPPPPGMAGSR